MGSQTVVVIRYTSKLSELQRSTILSDKRHPPVSHLRPSYPGLHTHTKSLAPFTQLEPDRHGLGLHSSMSADDQ